MLVKNESTPSSNNPSSRSSYEKLVSDQLSGKRQSSASFVVPLAFNRQASDSSFVTVPYSTGNCSSSSNASSGIHPIDSYRSHKRRRLDTIISELNNGSFAANGQGEIRRNSLLSDKCLAECCAHQEQVGDISSTTNSTAESGRRHAIHASQLISRPFAIQLASYSTRKEEGRGIAAYRLSVQQTSSREDSLENLAINLSYYDRQREDCSLGVSTGKDVISQVGDLWLSCLCYSLLTASHHV